MILTQEDGTKVAIDPKRIIGVSMSIGATGLWHVRSQIETTGGVVNFTLDYEKRSEAEACFKILNGAALFAGQWARASDALEEAEKQDHQREVFRKVLVECERRCARLRPESREKDAFEELVSWLKGNVRNLMWGGTPTTESDDDDKPQDATYFEELQPLYCWRRGRDFTWRLEGNAPKGVGWYRHPLGDR